MPTLFRYPLDPTGVSANNLVANEPHTLNNRAIRAFAPTYGAFFTESLVITDVTSGRTLTTSQYQAVELYEFPTGRYGKEICGVILITDTAVSNSIQITYQVLGGDYSDNTDAILAMLNTLNLDNRPVSWPSIEGKPAGFVPAMHYHDAGDVYGFEYVVHAIERLRAAVMSGDDVAHDAILKYIDQWGASLTTGGGNTSAALTAHTSNVSNPHQTTKAQVGLPNVVDGPLATTQQAQAGTINTAYMTPLTTAAAITTQAGSLITTHTSNLNNPHQTTATQVGLGSVQNFPLATTSDAQTGVSNVKYMTPALTAAAIATQALTPLNTHTARTDNPHVVTKAQLSLGNVQNYPMATTAQAQAGTDNASYMTPALTVSCITTYLSTNQNAVGDIIISVLPTFPTGLRRLLVQGQAVSLTTYPTLIALWCGATLNVSGSSDFFFRCTDPTNATTQNSTRSVTGNYLVLPPAGYFLRPINTTTIGADASRNRFLLQYDDNKAHHHAISMGLRGDAFAVSSPWHPTFVSDSGGTTDTANTGGTETVVKNWPVYVWLCY